MGPPGFDGEDGEDGAMVIAGSPPQSMLALNPHVIYGNFGIPAGYTVVIPRYVRIAPEIRLAIGSDGDLEVT